MQRLIRSVVALLSVVAATAVYSAGAGAATGSFGRSSSHVVFVQNDNVAGNQVVAYDRAPDGSLTQAGTYATGGLGGILAGSVVDHTASQGALTYDRVNDLLFAANAGSNNVSVFAVHDDQLTLEQVISSGGVFPVSVTVSRNVVYVLNARNGGSLQGYRVLFGRLFPLPGSTRPLGLDPAASPEFTNTPGQVLFSPDGRQLLVTTKANGSAIDVYAVDVVGYLSASPRVNADPGAVPFAATFDREGNLVVAEAGTNSLATFALASDGTIALLGRVPTGQVATCWVAAARQFFYASNAGSASLSGFRGEHGGQLTPLGNTPTDAGTVDADVSSDGRFIYVQAGATGKVDAFAITADGALDPIGTVTVPGAVGGEGIVAL